MTKQLVPTQHLAEIFGFALSRNRSSLRTELDWLSAEQLHELSSIATYLAFHADYAARDKDWLNESAAEMGGQP